MKIGSVNYLAKVFGALGAAVLVLLSSCNNSTTFEVVGDIKGMSDNGVAVFENIYTHVKDTVRIEHGKFEYVGSVSKPELKRLTIVSDRDSFRFQSKTDLFYIENTSIRISGNYDDLYDFDNRNYPGKSRINVVGGENNLLYNEYLDSVRPLLADIVKLNYDILLDTIFIQDKNPTQFSMAIQTQQIINEKLQQFDAIKNDFIMQNAHSRVAYDLIYASLSFNQKIKCIVNEGSAHGVDYTMAPSIPTKQLSDSWLSQIKKGTFSAEDILAIDSLAQNSNKIAKGAPFMDADLWDMNGEKVSLSNVLNTDGYTLIDCWASWCFPCRWFVPHLKQINEKYSSKGLKIISVSLDNRTEQEIKYWLRAVDEEQMPWEQYQSGAKSQFTSLYNVYSIPNIILIAPDKTVVKAGMRGLDVDIILDQIYSGL